MHRRWYDGGIETSSCDEINVFPSADTKKGGFFVDFRPFQRGDEFEQLTIFNTAAAALPKFRPTTLLDIQRRVSARDFDPATKCYAVANRKVVGYCSFQRNGRISYPWCLPGWTESAGPLFDHTIALMKKRGIATAFTAYRNDWTAINDFFLARDFSLAREMVNFVLGFENVPTASSRISSNVTTATVDDVPGIFALDPSVFRVSSAEALKDALWNDPWFKPESLFVMRNKGDGAPMAAGMFITNATFADPRAVDSSMPCFRLGAFGTEGMTHKRIKGLFSFVTRPDRNVFSAGMDLLNYAINKVMKDDDEITSYAAQVASDATALLAFYKQVFERQGSFPVYERKL
jgi:hypothetical protein